MPQTLDKKIVEWRDAETRARAAERALNHRLFSAAQELPGSEDLVTETRLLREQANEKLKAAIAAMGPKR